MYKIFPAETRKDAKLGLLLTTVGIVMLGFGEYVLYPLMLLFAIFLGLFVWKILKGMFLSALLWIDDNWHPHSKPR